MCVSTFRCVAHIRLHRCCRLTVEELQKHSVSGTERYQDQKLKTLRRNAVRLDLWRAFHISAFHSLRARFKKHLREQPVIKITPLFFVGNVWTDLCQHDASV